MHLLPRQGDRRGHAAVRRYSVRPGAAQHARSRGAGAWKGRGAGRDRHEPGLSGGSGVWKSGGILPQHIDEKQAVIDHINQDVITDVINRDCMLGLTVQPQKLSKYGAVSILDEYGFDKFLLNSDMSYKPSDPYSVPTTIWQLKKGDYNKNDIDKVAFKNAQNFFDIE